MIPQLFHTITRPSALLITQLLGMVQGQHLADVLSSFADVIPMGARFRLFSKLLEGLEEEDRGRAFAKLIESWGDKNWLRAAQLLLTMEAEPRVACIAEVLAPANLPTPASLMDEEDHFVLLDLLTPETADASTQLPVEHGEGDVFGGDLLPLEEELLLERLHIATSRSRDQGAAGSRPMPANSMPVGGMKKKRTSRTSFVIAGGPALNMIEALVPIAHTVSSPRLHSHPRLES